MVFKKDKNHNEDKIENNRLSLIIIHKTQSLLPHLMKAVSPFYNLVREGILKNLGKFLGSVKVQVLAATIKSVQNSLKQKH